MSLDIGAVLSQTFGTIKSRFGPLLGLWVVFFVIQIVFSAVMLGVIGTGMAFSGGAMENPLAMGFGFVVLMIVFYVFYVLIGFAQSASLTHQASALHSPPFGSSFVAGFKCSPTLLGLAIIFIVAYFLAVLVLAIIGGVMSFAGDIGSALFILLTIVLAVYVSCRISVVIPVIAVEGQRNPITAIARSWKLTEGNVLRIFGVLLVYVLMVGAALLLIFAIFGGTLMGMGATMAAAGSRPEDVAGMIGMMGGFFLVMLVVLALMTILWSSFMAALHAGLAGNEGVTETFA